MEKVRRFKYVKNMEKKSVLEIAKSQVGEKEEPAGSNLTKYGEWFGLNGKPWCGIFVSWCYFMAGMQLPRIGYLKGFAGVQTAVDYFKEKNWIVDEPEEGDIVFYNWDGVGRFEHTGIFSGWKTKSKARFFAYEGNTSLTNQSNGGQVMYRERVNKNVLFGRPKKS